MIDSDYIYQQYHRLESDNFRASIIHSLMNSLTDSEFTILWESEYYLDKDFRSLILSNLEKRINNKSDFLLAKGKEYFYKLDKVGYRKFVKKRQFITRLIQFYDEEFKQEYFYYFINSKRKVDRQQAIKVLPEIWDKAINKILYKKFIEYLDEDYLQLLINYGDISDKVDKIVDSYWGDYLPTYRVKLKILKILSNTQSKKIKKIKSEYPLLYIHFCINEDIQIKEQEQDKLIKSVLSKNGNSSFLIWCLGKLKRKNILELAVNEYEPKEFDYGIN